MPRNMPVTVPNPPPITHEHTRPVTHRGAALPGEQPRVRPRRCVLLHRLAHRRVRQPEAVRGLGHGVRDLQAAWEKHKKRVATFESAAAWACLCVHAASLHVPGHGIGFGRHACATASSLLRELLALSQDGV